MVELHENIVNTTKNHFVRVFYKNVTYNSDNEVQLTIPGMTYHYRPNEYCAFWQSKNGFIL